MFAIFITIYMPFGSFIMDIGVTIVVVWFILRTRLFVTTMLTGFCGLGNFLLSPILVANVSCMNTRDGS